jgi:O-antigen/teichoic acid export membrane protein
MTDVTVPSLGSRTVSAATLVAAGSMASNVIRLLSNLVLTRLLFPEAFGLMLIATTVMVIVAMLSDVGIQQSIVRGWRGEDPVYLDTAWTFQVLRGGVIWLAACGLAVALHYAVMAGWIPVNSTYADPQLPWVIVGMTFSSVILGFVSTDVAVATRRLNMKPLVLYELAVQAAGVVIMTALAWWMRSVWALVLGCLLTAVLQAVASHLVLRIHRNRFSLDRPSLRELFSFGKWLALSSSVSVFVSNGDRLILGALVSAQKLGLFSIAIALASALDQVLQSVISRVALPALSEMARNNPAGFARAFVRLRWRIDPAMLFAAGLLFALGPSVVGLLYDARYQEAGTMLQILSLGMVASRYSVAQQAYLALDEPRYQVVLNIARAVALYLLVPLAFHQFGMVGALYAIALREVAVLPLIFWFNSRHGLNSFRLEILWLAFWPMGWGLGVTFLAAKASLLGSA